MNFAQAMALISIVIQEGPAAEKAFTDVLKDFADYKAGKLTKGEVQTTINDLMAVLTPLIAKA